MDMRATEATLMNLSFTYHLAALSAGTGLNPYPAFVLRNICSQWI